MEHTSQNFRFVVQNSRSCKTLLNVSLSYWLLTPMCRFYRCLFLDIWRPLAITMLLIFIWGQFSFLRVKAICTHFEMFTFTLTSEASFLLFLVTITVLEKPVLGPHLNSRGYTCAVAVRKMTTFSWFFWQLSKCLLKYC